MTFAVRVPIDDDGGCIFFEVPREPQGRTPEGLVPASRPGKAGQATADARAVVLEEAACGLRGSLAPIAGFVKELRDSLHAAAPRDVKVEFGFDLGFQGGAPLVVHGTAACHVKVTLTWNSVFSGSESGDPV